MKKILLVVAASLFLTSCSLTAAQRADAKTVLNAISAACVIEHAELDVPSLEVACAIDQALTPEVEQLLSAYRLKLAAQLAAKRCR